MSDISSGVDNVPLTAKKRYTKRGLRKYAIRTM
jgi:hypothetical protein